MHIFVVSITEASNVFPKSPSHYTHLEISGRVPCYLSPEKQGMCNSEITSTSSWHPIKSDTAPLVLAASLACEKTVRQRGRKSIALKLSVIT